jgi:prophage regulatory protein
MDKVYYRIQELSELLSIGKSTIFKLMSQDKFPKRIKITSGIAVWDKRDIEAWCDEQHALYQQQKTR